jgi:hypothetical protein
MADEITPQVLECLGYSVDRAQPHVDITKPAHRVIVEIDDTRKVMYVHIGPVTILRICQIPGDVEVIKS